MSEWKLLVLEVDEPSKDLGDFFKRVWEKETVVKRIRGDLWNRDQIQKEVEAVVSDVRADRVLTVYGHGRYHHYTYGLCRAVADPRSRAYTYLHIDHHPDDHDFQGNIDLACGGFVNTILKKSNATQARCIGADINCGKSFKEADAIYNLQYTGPIMTERKGNRKEIDVRQNINASITRLLFDTPQDIYVSMDFDVMANEELKTDYSRGDLRLPELLECLDVLMKQRNLISADMLGYSSDELHGKSLAFYAIVAGRIIGKDTKRFQEQHNKFWVHPEDLF